VDVCLGPPQRRHLLFSAAAAASSPVQCRRSGVIFFMGSAEPALGRRSGDISCSTLPQRSHPLHGFHRAIATVAATFFLQGLRRASAAAVASFIQQLAWFRLRASGRVNMLLAPLQSATMQRHQQVLQRLLFYSPALYSVPAAATLAFN
jgi:hypothetical protein